MSQAVRLLESAEHKTDNSTQATNQVINHIGLNVPNVEKAVKWYSKMFGFQLMGNKVHYTKRSENPGSSKFSVYPESLQELKVALMTTGNGIGLEIFEFIEPKTYVPEDFFEYRRAGFFHICITDPDPDALADKIVAAGGSRIGVTVRPVPTVKCIYTSDPWGNVIEILDISFERFASLFHPGVR